MSDHFNTPPVCAIIIAHNPQTDVLERLLFSVCDQVSQVLIVDNGSQPEVIDWLRNRRCEQVELLELDDNIGLGAAQNLGMTWAGRRDHPFVLLLDQDSIPAAGMVDKLLATYRTISEREPVAAVGPTYLDPRTEEVGPFVRFGNICNRHIRCGIRCNQPFIRTDFLIASGMLIPLSVIDAIGNMNESLFVDFVDTEWSIRAASRGYGLFGVFDAVMNHTIGDRVSRFCKVQIRLSSSLRLYYVMRNQILLSRMWRSPAVSIVHNLLRSIRLFVIYALLIRPRRTNLLMMVRGLWHGLAGRTGRYDLVHKGNEWRETLLRAADACDELASNSSPKPCTKRPQIDPQDVRLQKSEVA